LTRAPVVRPPAPRTAVLRFSSFRAAVPSSSSPAPESSPTTATVARCAQPPAHLAGDYDDADGAGCSHW
jgi:hypothetical protein